MVSSALPRSAIKFLNAGACICLHNTHLPLCLKYYLLKHLTRIKFGLESVLHCSGVLATKLSQERIDQEETERRANLQSQGLAGAMTRFTEMTNGLHGQARPQVSTLAAKGSHGPVPCRVTEVGKVKEGKSSLTSGCKPAVGPHKDANKDQRDAFMETSDQI